MVLFKSFQYSSYQARIGNFQYHTAGSVHGHSLNPKGPHVGRIIIYTIFTFSIGGIKVGGSVQIFSMAPSHIKDSCIHGTYILFLHRLRAF